MSKQRDNLPEYKAPDKLYPQVHVFENKDPRWPGWLKVGYTTRYNVKTRIDEQFSTKLQLDKNPYILHHKEIAIDNLGVPLTVEDRDKSCKELQIINNRGP